MELFQFQEAAAAQVAKRVDEYLGAPVTITERGKKKPHVVPFFQALSALTGAGKTLVLASAVAQIAEEMPVAPVVLWLSRGKVVVQQSFANLSAGGKYHNLLDKMTIHALADYAPSLIADSSVASMFFATVGTFNQKDKDEGSLRIHKSDVDNLEQSVWDALRDRADAAGTRRPLVVVYDEAHNLSEQQTELLLELQPDVFLPATATMRIPARLGEEIGHLQRAGWDEDDLVTKVPTPDVVAAGLVKHTVLLQGYNSPMEETVASLFEDMKEASTEAEARGLPFSPKAIYVCDTNIVADTPNQTDSPKQPFGQRQAPPILIWRYLTEVLKVDPSEIAVYADLRVDKAFPLPDEFNLYRGGDTDYDDFTATTYRHIIFNLRLQEGWDDPAVYFAYIDKSMESTVQITQVIGRVLRQPEARHYPPDRLNTAHFYVRVDKNSVFNSVIEEVRKELGDSASGIKIVVSAPGKAKPTAYAPHDDFEVPETALDPSLAKSAIEKLLNDFPDFQGDAKNTKGEGSRRVFRQKVGEDGAESEWESFEQASQASARWIFHRELQRQFRAALGVVNLADPKLDAVVGIGSPAFHQVVKLAQEVVDAYIKNVRLTQRKSNPYVVGAVLAQPDGVKPFEHAVHDGYANLNSLELVFAGALDDTDTPWARNPPRSGYGIPLISVGATQWFYPDFLAWTEQRVVCIDTKGEHLIRDTAARKMLRIKPSGQGRRLDVQFVSLGKFDDNLDRLDTDGFTAWSLGDDGRIDAHHFADIESVAAFLLDDAQHPE